MDYISRKDKIRFKIEDILLANNSLTAINLQLYKNEIQKVKDKYPDLSLVIVPNSETADHKYHCIIAKKDI